MTFLPHHIAASTAELEGNGGRGRFLMLPGSRDRAERIAQRFSDSRIVSHPRGHDLHLGTLAGKTGKVDVGVVSTGMGCPSIDLIVTELIALGAGALLRVGTSGSLQPGIHTGDLVIATGAVRDERASDDYLPREFPALPSWSLLQALQSAAGSNPGRGRIHFGAVHTKDSLYGREMAFGPLAATHQAYNRLLTRGGVMASEMECAHLFVLAQLGKCADGPAVPAAAVLAVIGEHDQPFTQTPRAGEAVEDAIEVAFAALIEFAQS